MRLSLKTKFTLATSLLVLAVVTVVSALYIARLTRQTLRQADDRARFVAEQVFLACKNSLTDAAARGDFPASDSAADLRAYVQRALDQSNTLDSVMESAVGYSPTIYEISISDRDGIVMVSSDPAERGEKVAQRPPVSSLVRGGFFQQLRTLYGPPLVYEDSLPFNVGNGPFGDIRIGLSSALIRSEISPSLISAGYYALGSVLLSTLLALIVSRASLAPIDRISAQLDRISAGEFDLEPVKRGDEFGAVSTKIIGIGKQLRDVREIFSTLRENLDQVMSGLEDGLLLFNANGYTVLVSPSVEKFLGVPPEELRGRRASEIFPAGHPMREALGIRGDQIGAGGKRGSDAGRPERPAENRGERAGDPRTRRADGIAGHVARRGIARAHRQPVACFRATRGAGARDGGRGARSEKSAEFDAAVAGSFEGQYAGGSRAAAGREDAR